MSTAAASIASVRPIGAAPLRRCLQRSRPASSLAKNITKTRATSSSGGAAAYDEVFDGQTGQMVKVLSQSVETVSAGGLEWSYRVGRPEEGDPKPNKVLFVHGAGLVAFTFSKLMKEMQMAGFECVAPDMPGHGATSKPAPGGFKYDAAAYSAALEAFIAETGIAADEPVDLVVQGFFTSQVRKCLHRETKDDMSTAPSSPTLALPRLIRTDFTHSLTRHATHRPLSRSLPPGRAPPRRVQAGALPPRRHPQHAAGERP